MSAVPGVASLFEDAADVHRPVVFPTNRYNLLQILSARYIAPREAYSKYYSDLLIHSPGRIPLVRASSLKRLGELVATEGEASFPVVLELDTSAISDNKVPALRADGSPQKASLSDPTAVAWAPSGLIPISAVKRVIFRSQEDLKEHSARSYANIFAQGPPFGVDAEIFSSGNLDEDTLSEWLRTLPPGNTDSLSYRRADRLSGARCLATLALKKAPSAAPDVLRMVRPAIPKSRDRTISPDGSGPAPWLPLVTGVVVRASGDLNTKLFTIAVEVFQATDRQAEWRPVELLSKIESLAATKRLAKKDVGELARNLEPIRGILRNERDFKVFTPGVGLDVAKAILLVLLRPEAEELMDWPKSETGADDSVAVTAAVLCGLLSGRERLPITLRPIALDELLSLICASELSVDKDSLQLTSAKSLDNVVISRSNEKSGPPMESLVWNGIPLLTWDVPLKGPRDILNELDLTDGVTKQKVITLCRKLGWHNCVETEMVLDADEVRLSPRAKRQTLLSFRGAPVSTTHSLDADAFSATLRSTSFLSSDQEAIVAEIFGGAVK